ERHHHALRLPGFRHPPAEILPCPPAIAQPTYTAVSLNDQTMWPNLKSSRSPRRERDFGGDGGAETYSTVGRSHPEVRQNEKSPSPPPQKHGKSISEGWRPGPEVFFRPPFAQIKRHRKHDRIRVFQDVCCVSNSAKPTPRSGFVQPCAAAPMGGVKSSV